MTSVGIMKIHANAGISEAFFDRKPFLTIKIPLEVLRIIFFSTAFSSSKTASYRKHYDDPMVITNYVDNELSRKTNFNCRVLYS